MGSTWYILCGLVNNEQSGRTLTVDLGTETASVRTSPKAPMLDSHTAILAGETIILVFGGYIGAHKNNRVFTYSIKDDVWTEVRAEGKTAAPAPRANHTAVFFDGVMYVFGGVDAEGEKLDDLWKFDVAQHAWTQVPTKNEDGCWPRPRSGHIALVNSDKMYVFGGSLGVLQEVNDLFAFDLRASAWTIVHPTAKMVSEEERGSPITALKIKKEMDEAKRQLRGSAASPRHSLPEKGKKGTESCGVLALPDLSAAEQSFSTFRGSFKKSKVVTKRRGSIPDLDDEPSSPIVNMMMNSIVMKAKTTDRKKAVLEHSPSKTNVVIGRYPCGRDGHVGEICEGKLFVFGGDRFQTAYNDLFSYPVA